MVWLCVISPENEGFFFTQDLQPNINQCSGVFMKRIQKLPEIACGIWPFLSVYNASTTGKKPSLLVISPVLKFIVTYQSQSIATIAKTIVSIFFSALNRVIVGFKNNILPMRRLSFIEVMLFDDFVHLIFECPTRIASQIERFRNLVDSQIVALSDYKM